MIRRGRETGVKNMDPLVLFTGNYLQMMNVLRTIGFDVLECLSQLYDYYLYVVCGLLQYHA
jgi:hypothetical protein